MRNRWMIPLPCIPCTRDRTCHQHISIFCLRHERWTIHLSKINSVRTLDDMFALVLTCFSLVEFGFLCVSRFCLLPFSICLRLEFLSKQSLQWFEQRTREEWEKKTQTNAQHTTAEMNARYTNVCECGLNYSRETVLRRWFSICFALVPNHTWAYMFALCIFNAEVWLVRKTIIKFSRRL